MESSASNLPLWMQIHGIEAVCVEKHDRPLVQFTLMFPVGNYFDEPGRAGQVNLMGEMLLRGTQKRSREDIDKLLDFLGAELSVTVGASTMMLTGEVLRRNLPQVLHLVTELLSQPSFLESEIDKLKQEITAQLYLGLESDARLAKNEFMRRVFQGHPYGAADEGTPESLKRITRDDLLRIYDKAIRRKDMLIGVSGDITPDDFKTFFTGVVSSIPEGGQGYVQKPVPAVKPKERELVLVNKPDRSQTHFFIGAQTLALDHPDYLPLHVFMTAFAGGLFQAQYMQEIRVKRGWSYGAYGKVDSRRDGGAYFLYTYPKTGDTAEAIALSLSLLDQAVNGTNLSDEAIIFARNNLIRSFPFTIDLPEKVMQEAVTNKILGRPNDYTQTYTKKLEAITPAMAREAAKKHLDVNNVWIVVLGTEGDLKNTLVERLKPSRVDVRPFDAFE